MSYTARMLENFIETIQKKKEAGQVKEGDELEFETDSPTGKVTVKMAVTSYILEMVKEREKIIACSHHANFYDEDEIIDDGGMCFMCQRNAEAKAERGQIQ